MTSSEIAQLWTWHNGNWIKFKKKQPMHTQVGIYFHVCCQASEGNCDLYAHSAKSWEYQWFVQPAHWHWLKMTMELHRKTSGYYTESYDRVATNWIFTWHDSAEVQGPLPDQCPVLSQFTSAQQNLGVTLVTIYDSKMMIATELGIMPQLWDLFGKVGGYLALLTLIFHTCFVKKYPESGVAQVYEARTFIGDRIPIIGSPSSREGAQAQAEASRPLPRPPGMYKDLDTEWRKVMLQRWTHNWAGRLLQTGLAFVCFTCHFRGNRSD